MDKSADVQNFVSRLKNLLELGMLFFMPRNSRKTWDFMLAEGLAEDDAFDIIAQLGPEHHHWGPGADDDSSPGDVMVFFFPYARLFPPYDRILLYIKLKILVDLDTGKDAGIVMSFHDEGNI